MVVMSRLEGNNVVAQRKGYKRVHPIPRVSPAPQKEKQFPGALPALRARGNGGRASEIAGRGLRGAGCGMRG